MMINKDYNVNDLLYSQTQFNIVRKVRIFLGNAELYAIRDWGHLKWTWLFTQSWTADMCENTVKKQSLNQLIA